MKTSELIGPALDWAVAKALGKEVYLADFGTFFPWKKVMAPALPGGRVKPSTNWSQGGPIIEREAIALDCREDWRASMFFQAKPCYEHGPLHSSQPCAATSPRSSVTRSIFQRN